MDPTSMLTVKSLEDPTTWVKESKHPGPGEFGLLAKYTRKVSCVAQATLQRALSLSRVPGVTWRITVACSNTAKLLLVHNQLQELLKTCAHDLIMVV